MIDPLYCLIDYDKEREEKGIGRETLIEQNIMTLVYSQTLRVYIYSETFYEHTIIACYTKKLSYGIISSSRTRDTWAL